MALFPKTPGMPSLINMSSGRLREFVEQCLTENQNGYLQSDRYERVDSIAMNSRQNNICSVTKVVEAFVLVTDTYKQLTRNINYITNNWTKLYSEFKMKYKRKNDI